MPVWSTSFCIQPPLAWSVLIFPQTAPLNLLGCGLSEPLAGEILHKKLGSLGNVVSVLPKCQGHGNHKNLISQYRCASLTNVPVSERLHIQQSLSSWHSVFCQPGSFSNLRSHPKLPCLCCIYKPERLLPGCSVSWESEMWNWSTRLKSWYSR